MRKTELIKLLFTHPDELRALITYKLYYEKKRDIKAQREHETSGWDRPTMRRCWEFLDMTSRSFSAVIKELDGDLARVIALYYLVLRGLDTVEDDTSIPDDVKQPILRSFHQKLSQPGWTYDKIRPEEKDRQLLVEFDVVIDEIMRLDPKYRDPIVDICLKMETGMADFCHAASSSSHYSVTTWQEYDLYCHYVAGLVGEGLSRLFSASGKESPHIADQLVLSNSMGALLQKTNILRDFREDLDADRLFWPREVWEKHGFTHPHQMGRDTDSKSSDSDDVRRAVWALNEMILDAMTHSIDALDYLTLLRNQSVFNFVAIPATMAIATLEVCFGNREVLRRNVKIRKGEAVKLIMRSTNPREVALIFLEYARRIHAKALTSDPNFLAICIMCGKIEQWVESHYPSFVLISSSPFGDTPPTTTFASTDARSRIIKREHKLELEKKYGDRAETALRANAQASGGVPLDLLAFVFGGVILVVAMGLGVAWIVATYLG